MVLTHLSAIGIQLFHLMARKPSKRKGIATRIQPYRTTRNKKTNERRLPFEIERMIIKEIFRRPHISLNQINSCVRVCWSWNEEIRRILSSDAIVQARVFNAAV